MTDAESIEAMLDALKDIKSQRDDAPTDDEEPAADGECNLCGSDDIKREVVPGNGANRTASRHVGGQNMRVRKVCRDCGNGWF